MTQDYGVRKYPLGGSTDANGVTVRNEQRYRQPVTEEVRGWCVYTNPHKEVLFGLEPSQTHVQGPG